MKFKFAIIGITAILIAMFVQNTIEEGFKPLNLLGIVIVAAFLFWVDHQLERPISRSSIKRDLKK